LCPDAVRAARGSSSTSLRTRGGACARARSVDSTGSRAASSTVGAARRTRSLVDADDRIVLTGPDARTTVRHGASPADPGAASANRRSPPAVGRPLCGLGRARVSRELERHENRNDSEEGPGRLVHVPPQVNRRPAADHSNDRLSTGPSASRTQARSRCLVDAAISGACRPDGTARERACRNSQPMRVPHEGKHAPDDGDA
jgi:hypothetical protein